ncbi:neutral/alkaline non-lysosomal ceramidase C-terminal domain-containing protein [Legionella parisiensis]|uniref:Neutral/alkaline non-lysosomal ceramidase C-terminal domain-containing protein n=1 Tax=Legionella parisiensis TaxID=45071 RepID=A0A1E5JWB1_9GAMM|nr:hypothetical protein lpari_00272 [Legionella parisiensis]
MDFTSLPSLKFGGVHLEPNDQYQRGDLVHVIFWAGHPGNNFETMKGILQVQFMNSVG